ncbi:MAG: DUF445 family protein [Bacteroidetes bacterium]|nr:DUF445 family protein [Bacteroidota bacterium]MCH8524630.1 DUF445 domain-containing protein [Balneolales bacterium]
MKNSFSTNTPPLRYRLLVIIPWLLVVSLVSSLFITLPIYTIDVFGYTVSFEGIVRMISVGGLIGFFTNWIAITMLFRPTEKRPLLGQGLIPSQKDIISKKLAQAIQKNLINAELIQQRMADEHITDKLLNAIENKTAELTGNQEFRESIYTSVKATLNQLVSDEELRNTYAQQVLAEMGSAIPSGSVEKLAFNTYLKFRGTEARSILNQTIQQIPSLLYNNRSQFDDIIESIPLSLREHRQVIRAYITEAAQKLVDEIDIQSIVYENLNTYDEKRLEWLIKTSTMDQLNYIKYLGGVLGMLGGLVIWNPALALILIGTGVTIYLTLDSLLYNLE